MDDKWKVFVTLLIAVILAAVGEALAAKGMKQSHNDSDTLALQIRAALLSWRVWAGFFLMVGYVVLYVYTLGLEQLSFVLPLSASSYLLGALLSKFYLQEEIKPARWIGTAIIILGVLVVAAGGSGGEK